jgi:hypothetical protein
MKYFFFQAVESGAFASENGGGLFAFEIPKFNPKKENIIEKLRDYSSWKRYTLFRGFKV